MVEVVRVRLNVFFGWLSWPNVITLHVFNIYGYCQCSKFSTFAALEADILLWNRLFHYSAMLDRVVIGLNVVIVLSRIYMTF